MTETKIGEPGHPTGLVGGPIVGAKSAGNSYPVVPAPGPEDFPRMLHHPTKPPVTVNSAAEQKQFEAAGYSADPAVTNPEAKPKAKAAPKGAKKK